MAPSTPSHTAVRAAFTAREQNSRKPTVICAEIRYKSLHGNDFQIFNYSANLGLASKIRPFAAVLDREKAEFGQPSGAGVVRISARAKRSALATGIESQFYAGKFERYQPHPRRPARRQKYESLQLFAAGSNNPFDFDPRL